MPGSDLEIVHLATSSIVEEEFCNHHWEDNTTPTNEEIHHTLVLRRYHLQQLEWERRKHPKPAQRRAMKLLRQFLSVEQLHHLATGKCFLVHTKSGATYRLHPYSGSTELVTKHGSRWYSFYRFCLHDDPDDTGRPMPPADLVLTHLLMLNHDESEFLRLANKRYIRDQLWNGHYLRRMRQARLQRLAV